jgi:hypothetical protein
MVDDVAIDDDTGVAAGFPIKLDGVKAHAVATKALNVTRENFMAI